MNTETYATGTSPSASKPSTTAVPVIGRAMVSAIFLLSGMPRLQ